MYRVLSEAAVKAYTSKNKAEAKSLISDASTPVPALFAAAQVLLGSGWQDWLWETVVHELTADGLSPNHADALGALQGVACTGAPWRDYQAFAVAANVFADLPPYTHGFVPPDPQVMAALVPEMSIVFALAASDEDTLPEFSDEVEAYVAAALASHGLCCAPDELAFAQERLNSLCAQHTCEKSKKASDVSEGAKSEDPTPSDNIQTHRYEEIQEYVKQRLNLTLAALKRLT